MKKQSWKNYKTELEKFKINLVKTLLVHFMKSTWFTSLPLKMNFTKLIPISRILKEKIFGGNLIYT